MTVSGDLGSGKTYVSRTLAGVLGYRYLSTGQLHRDIAAELGMNSLELNLHAEENPEIDKRVDAALAGLSEEGLDYVVDSRMAWHFVPTSLKVYLMVDPDVGSARVMSDKTRLNEPSYEDQQDAKVRLLARKESENKRFLEEYGVDCSDLRNYDVIVDATLLTPDQVIGQLVAVIGRWKEGLDFNKYWTSPRSLFPTEHVEQVAGQAAGDLRAGIERDDSDPDHPIEVVSYQNFWFIWKGHRRASAALLAKRAVVPIVVLARDQERLPTGETAEEFARASMIQSRYHDWEKAHGFRFHKYPGRVAAEAGREGLGSPALACDPQS